MHSGTPYITHHMHIHTNTFGRDMVTSQTSRILHHLENHLENPTMLQLATVFTFRHVSIPLQCLFNRVPSVHVQATAEQHTITITIIHTLLTTIHFLLAFTHSVLNVTTILCTVFMMSI